MYKVKVTGVGMKVGAGALLGLTVDQSTPRLHAIDKIGPGIFKARRPMDFKRGEEFMVGSIDDIPKGMRDLAVITDPDAAQCEPPTPHVVIDPPTARKNRR